MRPYGRRGQFSHSLHGERCLVCYPPTRSAKWHAEPYAEAPIKARDRQRARREVKEEIDEWYRTHSLRSEGG